MGLFCCVGHFIKPPYEAAQDRNYNHHSFSPTKARRRGVSGSRSRAKRIAAPPPNDVVDAVRAVAMAGEPAPQPARPPPHARRLRAPPEIRPEVRRSVRPVPSSGHQGGALEAAQGGGRRPHPAPQARHGPLHEAPVPPRRPPGSADTIQRLFE